MNAILGILCLIGCLGLSKVCPAETLRVATLNVQNYNATDRMAHGRYFRDYPKPEAEKAALRRVIASVNADILALQEMGPESYLFELLRDLKAEGVSYPHMTHVLAHDPDRTLAVLSRLPFAEVQQHTQLEFKYFDGLMPVKRGLLECRFEVNGVQWTLFNLHLKSPYSEREDDPLCEVRRVGEAEAIRKYIYQKHWQGGSGRYLVAGDFNDHKASRTLARFLKQGDKQLSEMLTATDAYGEAWTFHYAREDRYERIDFILAAPALMLTIQGQRAHIHDSPDMRTASDHRLVFCDLEF